MALVAAAKPNEPANTSGGETSEPDGLPPLTPELVSLLEVPADVPARLSIAQVSALTGASTYTLRYWERVGLLAVGRGQSRRRVYDRDALAQVLLIGRLRASDMAIETIRRYVGLVNAGEHTVTQRLELMRAHRVEVLARLDALRSALTVIDHKIASYSASDHATTTSPTR